MLVRNLIGRNAGQIQDQPYHAATSNIAMGTAASVTDDEIREAGLEVPKQNPTEAIEQFPKGYKCKADDITGFNVLAPKSKEHPEGEQINVQPFQNMAVARSAAYEHQRLAHETAEKERLAKGAGTGNQQSGGQTETKEDLSKLTRDDLEKIAHKHKLDISKAKNKAEIIAIIEAPRS